MPYPQFLFDRMLMAVILNIMSQFSKVQLDKISNYLMDLSKILFGSAVVGFFIPGFSGQVNLSIFVVGLILSTTFLALGIKILNTQKL